MIPAWLHEVSLAYLCLGGLSGILIAIDVIRHPQQMGIMSLVWPLTALFGTAPVALLYFKYGRLASREAVRARQEAHGEPRAAQTTPLPVMVATATLHCGGGCALGDLCAEWLVFAVPAIAAAFGWHALFSEKIFAVWIADYVFAYGFGMVFQYFTIAPMRGLSFGAGLVAAVKADTLSLTAWQIGMYALMAIVYFGLFRGRLGIDLRTDTPEFWFAMQVAMICGFGTSYPVNGWLVRRGVKERM